jgi:hypothetical protein
MSFSDLSVELVERIALFLERDEDQSQPQSRTKLPSNLPPYATISRQWQNIIERRTFKSLLLKSTELDYFDSIYTAQRAANLARLRYTILLPTYDDKACARFERQKDQKANDEAFSAAVTSLFQLIAARGNTSLRPMSLTISDIHSPMDRCYRDREKLDQDQLNSFIGKRRDLWEHRYEHSYLHLLHPENLPTLMQIQDLSLSAYVGRRVAPQSAAAMATKMSKLENISFDLWDNEKTLSDVRRENRLGMQFLLIDMLSGY